MKLGSPAASRSPMACQYTGIFRWACFQQSFQNISRLSAGSTFDVPKQRFRNLYRGALSNRGDSDITVIFTSNSVRARKERRSAVTYSNYSLFLEPLRAATTSEGSVIFASFTDTLESVKNLPCSLKSRSSCCDSIVTPPLAMGCGRWGRFCS